MTAQGAAGAGEAVQSTSESEDRGRRTEDRGQQADAEEQVAQPTLLGALLSEMGVKEQKTEDVTADAGQGGQRTEVENSVSTEGEQQVATGEETVAGEAKAVPDEWPDSAKARVAEEADKRRHWKTQAEKWQGEAETSKARAAELEEQLKGLPRVQAMPTAADPLAHVTDENQLRQEYANYEDLLEFAELHRDGATDVVIGTDAKGQPVTRDFTAEDIAKVRVQADRMLRRALPEKAQYLQQAAKAAEEARGAFPELFDPKSQTYKDAFTVVSTIPEVTRFPDWPIYIGDMLAGRAARLAKENGNGAARNGNGAAELLKKKPGLAPLLNKKTLAPGVTNRGGIRSLSGDSSRSGDADVEKATKELREKRGRGNSLENYFTAKLLAGQKGSGGRAAVPI